MPDRFSTRIEVNQNGKVASDLYINFDYVKSRAAISIVNNNTETKLIFDYFTDEIHEIVQWANYSKGPLVPGKSVYNLIRRELIFNLILICRLKVILIILPAHVYAKVSHYQLQAI